MRAPFQTLIIPYKIEMSDVFYGVFLRKKQNIWQFVAGGGEDVEKPIETAVRELKEETCINVKKEDMIELDTKSTIPVVNITGKFTWGEDVFVVTEYTFGINVSNLDIKLSNEHKEFVWLRYKEALKKLEFDSNKIALWELNERLKRSYNWN